MTLTIAMLFSSQLFAQSVREKGTVLGVKAGLIGSGTLYVEDFAYETEASFSLGGFVDYQLSPKLYGGLSLDMDQISAFDETKMIYNFGMTLKALVYGQSSKLTFRPGFGLAYGAVSAIGDLDNSSYFTVNGFLELVIPTEGNLSWLIEVAFYGAPSGGNAALDITFGPMIRLRGGLIF